MTTHELKPCPFCGHETNAVSDNGAGLVFTVVCGNGSCRARGPWERCAGDAPHGWNTRTNDQALSTLTDEVEELREALEPFSEASEAIGAAWGPDLPLAACRGFTGNILMVRDLRRARATLTKGEGDKT